MFLDFVVQFSSIQFNTCRQTNLSILKQNAFVLFVTVYIYPDCCSRTSCATEPDDDTGTIRKQQPDALQQKNDTALLPWSRKTQWKNKEEAHT
jgi:hypothetical protein